MSDEDEPLIALLHEARTRDRAEPASALSARILADFDAVSARRARWSLSWFVDAVWPGAPVWKPAAAFGLSLMIGLGVGTLLPVYGAGDESSIVADTSPGLDFGGYLR